MLKALVPYLCRVFVFCALAAQVRAADAAPAADPEVEYKELLALSRTQLPAALRSDEQAKIA